MRVRESLSAGPSRGRSSFPFAAMTSHSVGAIASEPLWSSIASMIACLTSDRYASCGLARIESASAVDNSAKGLPYFEPASWLSRATPSR